MLWPAMITIINSVGMYYKCNKSELTFPVLTVFDISVVVQVFTDPQGALLFGEIPGSQGTYGFHRTNAF